MINETDIPKSLIDGLKISKNVTVLTGAGISAESGIKTFRDPDGLWTKFNPSELASMDGFMKNPELVWKWYQFRREVINKSAPNPGHYAIAEMQNLFNNFTLITQNVDRLHHRSGSKDVLELHGNIIDNYCIKCGEPYTDLINFELNEIPKCKICNNYIRPAVVWFGEMLPEKVLLDAEFAAKQSDVFFTIGTSAEVYPAANLPLYAKSNGAVVVEINPNETQISKYLDYNFRYPSGVILPLIIKIFKESKGIK
jgi:NAD-dependent deacetylase